MPTTRAPSFTALHRTIALALAGAAFAPSARGGEFDWPQWQGPDRTAHSKETGLLKEWPKEGPPVAWKIKGLGGGDSTPSIAAGRIYGMSHRGEEEFVWALAEKDGKEIWAVKIAPAHVQNWPQSKEGPSCTPTVDGDRIYVMGLAGNVACLQAADGKVLWQRSLVADFGGKNPMWNFRESPLVDGDKVICTPGGTETTMVALNKMTGATIWKSALPASPSAESASPASPAPPASPASPPSPGPAGFGGGGEGGGGRGNFGGFSIASSVGPQIFAQGDANKDQKLSQTEFTALADTWFDRLDPQKTDKVTGAQFAERFYDAVPRPQNAAAPDGSNPGQRRPSRSTAPAFFTAVDTDKDGSVTRAELKTTFTKWHGQWDTEKGGTLTEEKFRTGLNAALPAPQFGGGGGGGGRGFGGRGGGDSGAGYASAIAIDFEGQRQYVQLTSKALLGVAAADGKFLWRYDRPANRMGITITTPLYRDGLVFATSAYGAGGGAVKLSKDANGGIKAEEAWFSRNMENHHGSVIVVDGALYGANGGNGGGYLACLDYKTGDVLWNERDSDKRRVKKGSVAFADGRIYYRTEEGAIILIEPSRKEYLERGRFEQPERTDKPAWAHPIVANGKLYIRDQDTLFCYDVKAK
jgi:alcohol dehydrogenase (cytochrome c)